MDSVDKIFAFLLSVCLVIAFIAALTEKPKNRIDLHYPSDSYGARIPGTNYLVDGNDTLEIVPSYHYRILDKEERKQAREYIKSIRK